MQQIEIWLVILFLSTKKLHAKQNFVLSRSMELGQDVAQKVHLLAEAIEKQLTHTERLFYLGQGVQTKTSI